MSLVLLQTDIVWENKSANFDRVRRLLEATAPSAGSLVVLPEMFATGFSLNVPVVADSPDQETVLFLCHQAKTYQSYFLAGLVSMDKTGLGRNQAVLISPDGKEILRYTKIHPFSYAHEDDYFLPGREIVLFDWAGFTVCPFICYDLRFPEIFRHAVGRGANLFVVMANWPKRRKRHWEILLSARAVENQAYVVGVNRVGRDPNLAYPGLSRMIDPEGNIIARAEGEESAITASLDLEKLLKYRERFPAIRDRRFDVHTHDGR